MTTRTWHEYYEPGVPYEINISKDQSLLDICKNSFKQFPNHKAYSCMGKSLTFSEIDRLSSQLAGYFSGKLGLKKGDIIALMMPNVLQYPIAIAAALKSGLIIVNVNPLYTARELEHQLKDSQASAIIILENFAHQLQLAQPKIASLRHIITTSLGDLLAAPKSWIVNFVVKHIKKMVPAFELPQATSFVSALAQGQQHKVPQVSYEQQDIAFLQYTGGTTGVSKGAMLTHYNILANIEQASTWIANYVTPGKETIITALPLYHIFSLTANFFTFMKLGGHNILITNPRDIPNFVKELSRYRFSAITGVNTLFNALLNNADFRQLDFSPLRLTLGGGMAVQSAVADRWQQVTSCPLIQAYGLTETSPAVCINPLNLPKFNGKIGLPISSTLVTIRDDDGKEVAIGQPGELWVKGPQVTPGYWQNKAETANLFSSDGWLRTGDIATIDKKGFCEIVDRKKDMIIVSGFNVYPNEIEDVVTQLSQISEAAAIGIDDSKSGEVVKLFAVINEGSTITKEEIIDYCRQNLTRYKVPKQIKFCNELPKTNVGKILRRALRDK